VLPCIAVALSLSSASSWSQAGRTVKVVVPGVPGASNDILARVLAEAIGRDRGVTMVVENRPGAGNVVGSEAVARAAPDGNTLLINAPPFVIDPHLRKLSYDPLTSFEPICYLAHSPSLIVVGDASPLRTLKDMLGAARTKSGAMTVAGVGPGTASHMAFEMLNRAASVDMTFVPYPGNPPAMTALLGGHVDVVITGYAAAADLVNTGKLRVLATTSGSRIETLPEVPTVAEFGYKDYAVDFWIGVVAPAKTRKETVSQLGQWFTAALQTTDTKNKLIAQALYPVGLCGADFAAFIRQRYDEYGRVIRDAKIKLE